MSESDLETSLKNLALLMTVHCVRNTIIEDYHTNGNITDPEMMAFNKEVVNNIYTILQILHNPKYNNECAALFEDHKIFYLPTNWDEPKLNPSMVRALRNTEDV
jgi:hypothetical protein